MSVLSQINKCQQQKRGKTPVLGLAKYIYYPSTRPVLYKLRTSPLGHKSNRKNEDPYLTARIKKTRLIRCLLYLFNQRKRKTFQVKRCRTGSFIWLTCVKEIKRANFIGFWKSLLVVSMIWNRWMKTSRPYFYCFVFSPVTYSQSKIKIVKRLSL